MFPDVMRNAVEDLGATVEGRFSPEDWDRILARAEVEFRRHKDGGEDDTAAWSQVMRDFRRDHYWGFQPGYRKPKVKKKPNLAAGFIWLLFSSMVLFRVIVVWLGLNYANSGDDLTAKVKLYAMIAFVLANFVYFLWRHRAYKD